MGKKKNRPSGEEQFDSYFSEIYGPRWTTLREALSRPTQPEAHLAELVKPYFLDRASVIAATALNVQSGDTVLDLCAAPGGKSLVLALALRGTGSLTSNDRSADRRGRLKKVIEEHLPEDFRKNIRVTGHDATRWGLYEKNVYDRILLDAPCSSERHVLNSAAHLAEWTPRRTQNLAMQAMAMLCSALEALKSGGTLVYSTCSISPEENENLLERFSSKRSGLWSELDTGGDGEKKKWGRILLPDVADGIGPLFYCVILKT